MRRTRVAIIFGGRSGEHEVSCVSARHVAGALDPEKFEVIPIAISRYGEWLLPEVSRKVLEGGHLEVPAVAFIAEGEPVTLDSSSHQIVPSDRSSAVAPISDIDVVFPVLHGPNGEDGTVQGLLELMDVAYVGSGVLGSALGMDKEKMKIVLRAAGLPGVEFVTVRDREWRTDMKSVLHRAGALGFPLFTKPANLGSSVGIRKCTDALSLVAGVEEALRHDRKVLVEEGIVGRELEVAVLGNDEPSASVVGEIIASREFYDYEAKYSDTSSQTRIPADLPPEVSDQVRGYSIAAFKAIDAAGLARVDFFYEETGRGVLVNEINTIPGFTTISMYPKLWEASGIAYPDLISRLLDLAQEKHARKPRPI